MIFALSVIAIGLGFTPMQRAPEVEQALLIAELRDPSNAAAIASYYEIDLLDTSGGAPFILYQVSEREKNQTMVRMSKDARIAWVEDDSPIGSPEGKDQRPEDIRARVGGTIPSVFDGRVGAEFNKNYLSQIGWKTMPTLANKGRDIKVAVLDTGLSPYQPALWNNVFASMNTTSGVSVYDLPSLLDTNGNGFVDEGVGHGTFVTSIIVTLAPNAKIAVIKVADSDGVATSWTIIKGLAFAVQSGCEIANISLGSKDRPKALGDALDWVDANGLTVIAAGGNDSKQRTTYPSRYSSVVAVAGIDENDQKALFSNYESHVEQSAPSVIVAGAWWEGGAVGWSGTSFAAPFVTGCLADTAQWRGFWWPDRVRRLLLDTGTDIDGLNPDYRGNLGLRVDWRALYLAQR